MTRTMDWVVVYETTGEGPKGWSSQSPLKTTSCSHIINRTPAEGLSVNGVKELTLDSKSEGVNVLFIKTGCCGGWRCPCVGFHAIFLSVEWEDKQQPILRLHISTRDA